VGDGEKTKSIKTAFRRSIFVVRSRDNTDEEEDFTIILLFEEIALL
jgi:hypothetical protein